MKTFPSQASRIRKLVGAARIGGWVMLAGGVVYLMTAILFPPRQEQVLVLAGSPPPRAIASSRPAVVAILGSRSLREEVKPPPPVAVLPPPPQVIHPPDLEVVATIVNPGETPSAYVRSRATKKLTTIRPGGTIDGATVKEITEGQVIFELQGQDFPIQVGRKGP